MVTDEFLATRPGKIPRANPASSEIVHMLPTSCPNSPKSSVGRCQMLADVCKVWPTCFCQIGQSGSKFGRSLSEFGPIRLKLTASGPHRSMSGQSWPHSAEIRPISTDTDHAPSRGHVWTRPSAVEISQCRAKVGPSLAELGHVRPMLGHIWSKSVNPRPNLN